MNNPPRIASKIRKYLLICAYYAGVFSLFRWLNRERIVIFMLHGVLYDEPADSWTPIRARHTASHLETTLKWLGEYHEFSNLDMLLDGSIWKQRNPVIFTFDDGYRNNMTVALPIFEKYRVPMTVYVTTKHVKEQKPLWFDELDFALQCQQCAEKKICVTDSMVKIDFRSRKSLSRSFARLRELLKTRYADDLAMRTRIDEICQELRETCQSEFGEALGEDLATSLLKIEDVKRLAKNELVTIGSHTQRHYRLGLVPLPIVTAETVESKKDLERWTKQEVRHFAYPDGSESPLSREIVGRTEYKTAVTTQEGFNSVNTDYLRLKRVHLPYKVSQYELLAITSGFSQFLSDIKRRIGILFPRDITTKTVQSD